jgi:serine protease
LAQSLFGFWPGGDGKNVTIVDVEYSFNGTHEDLKSVAIVGGGQYNGYGNDHGTAVLGELIGKNNGYGVKGIAYGAIVKFSGACSNGTCSSYNPANAITTARTRTTKGDVILVEQQNYVCNSNDYGPIEWDQAVFDAIKLATSAGRIVVEAAGNGGVNLDAAGCEDRFNRATRNSGAIIVGAGAPPNYSQADRSRLDFSTYGKRVDLQGWGMKVVTTGYGDLYAGSSSNQWYTATFGGTSSASPIVAGAVALLSSVAQARGVTKTPAWIRSTLVSTGSPQQAATGFPLSQHIGPRPNLKQAITKLPPA